MILETNQDLSGCLRVPSKVEPSGPLTQGADTCHVLSQALNLKIVNKDNAQSIKYCILYIKLTLGKYLEFIRGKVY